MLSLIKSDIQAGWRNRHEILNPLLFFVLVCLLFPFGMNASSQMILTLLPTIIWVALLLAILMTLSTLFRAEYDDGRLELFMLSSHSIYLIILSKVFTHWLLNVAPLMLFSLFISMILGLSLEAVQTLAYTILLGTPILILIGAIASSLTVASKQNSALLALLVLPLYVPVLIFSTSAVTTSMQGMNTAGALYVLASLLILSLTMAPFAIAVALKLGVSQ